MHRDGAALQLHTGPFIGNRSVPFSPSKERKRKKKKEEEEEKGYEPFLFLVELGSRPYHGLFGWCWTLSVCVCVWLSLFLSFHSRCLFLSLYPPSRPLRRRPRNRTIIQPKSIRASLAEFSFSTTELRVECVVVAHPTTQLPNYPTTRLSATERETRPV